MDNIPISWNQLVSAVGIPKKNIPTRKNSDDFANKHKLKKLRGKTQLFSGVPRRLQCSWPLQDINTSKCLPSNPATDNIIHTNNEKGNNSTNRSCTNAMNMKTDKIGTMEYTKIKQMKRTIPEEEKLQNYKQILLE